MPIMEAPIISQWYKHRDKGDQFQVIAADEETVQLQHFDGDIEELDRDAWPDLEVTPIEAPEDWTGPMDDIERDDLGYDEPAADLDEIEPADEDDEIEEEENPDDREDEED